MFYVLLFWTSLGVRERRREGITTASRMYHPKEKKEIKSGTSGCGSFVVPYFQPATSSTDRLYLALRTGLEVGKPNNIPAKCTR